MSSAGFWINREVADGKIREMGQLNNIVSKYEEISIGIDALLLHSNTGAFDESAFHEIKRKFHALELEMLFAGPYDGQAAVISIFPGAGGDDAGDWARMLGTMYEDYAKRHGWKVKVIDDNPRSWTAEIAGEHAYGYLKHESGVHRLVRISPFNAKHSRETSFALVEVVPDLPTLEESKMQIPEMTSSSNSRARANREGKM